MPELITNPWDVSESDFPAASIPAGQLRFLLNYAVLAPSRHNVQPWLFRVEDHHVELYADHSRSLSVTDPENREMTISCGAALTNLILAIRYFGSAPAVEICSCPGEPQLLARVSLEKGMPATLEERRLFHAIPLRRTNRQPRQRRPLPAVLLSDLEEMGRQEGVRLQFVREEEERSTLASLIATGDRLLWASEQFRQEIAAWTRPLESQAHDGVPVYALGRGDMVSYLGPLKIRTFMDQAKKVRDQHAALSSPAFAILWTFADTWFDWLAAGQALEKVLLRAAAEQVWAAFFSQPVEIPTLRQEISTTLGQSDVAQVVLGYGAQALPTPRRSVGEVLI